MSKLKNERAEVKAEGASKKIQKRFAPAVRRWNDRVAKTGPNKGEICIPVKGTEYRLCVTKEEMRQAEIELFEESVEEETAQGN